MIQCFVVYDEKDKTLAVFYTDEEALRFILVSGQVHNQNTSDWYYTESVLGNNADKLASAMYGKG